MSTTSAAGPTVEVGDAVWIDGDVGLDGEGHLVQAKNCITASGENTVGFLRPGTSILMYANQVPQPLTKKRLACYEELSTKFRVLTWDWKEQLDLAKLQRAISVVSSDTIYLTNVEDTGGDMFAAVVSNIYLHENEAQAIFEDDWRDQDDD